MDELEKIIGNKKVRIAVIDDDDIFQFIASKAIRSLSNSSDLLQFQSGIEAMKYLTEHAKQPEQLPDTLLVDINMPLLDGWMFLEEFNSIKSNINKDITVFMVSSSIDELDINRAKQDDGIADYLLKPISIEKYKELLAC